MTTNKDLSFKESFVKRWGTVTIFVLYYYKRSKAMLNVGMLE